LIKKKNHIKLLNILLDRGFPSCIVNFFFFWFQNQTSCIKWNDKFSDFFSVRNGVRQGGVLSPIFYNIYINNIFLDIQSSGIGCFISNYPCNIFAYADDLVLLAPTINALQKLVNISLKFCNNLDIIMNQNKTVCMAFSSEKNLKPFDIFLDNTKLKTVTEFKYLGFLLTHSI